ncbi:ADAMTS-like protein 3, partial [Clarias magur]
THQPSQSGFPPQLDFKLTQLSVSFSRRFQKNKKAKSARDCTCHSGATTAGTPLTRILDKRIILKMDLLFISVWQMSMVFCLIPSGNQAESSQSQTAYFLPEFALSPQGSFLEDTTGEQYLTYRYDDQ